MYVQFYILIQKDFPICYRYNQDVFTRLFYLYWIFLHKFTLLLLLLLLLSIHVYNK